MLSLTPSAQGCLFLNLRISLRHGRREGDSCEVTKPQPALIQTLVPAGLGARQPLGSGVGETEAFVKDACPCLTFPGMNAD